jgi:hypothetical protein
MSDTIVDLDDNARIPAMPKQRPPARRAEDIPARWRERTDLAGYAACSRQGRPDGTMRYDICSDTFQNREQAHNAREYLTQKRGGQGVDFVVMELREVVR